MRGKEGRELSLEEPQHLKIRWNKQEAPTEVGHVRNLTFLICCHILSQLMLTPLLHSLVQKPWSQPWLLPCPHLLLTSSPSHPYPHPTSILRANYGGCTFRVPRICHLILWQVPPHYGPNYHDLALVSNLNPLKSCLNPTARGQFSDTSCHVIYQLRILRWHSLLPQ